MGFFSSLGAIGSVLGGVGSIIGGSKGASSAKSINAMQMQLAREQFDFQKDYVKNRLQWQVEDAQKAGLHPMVAAGLSPASFSPVSANLSPVDYDWVGEAGQSLAYAATKAKTNKQQQMAFDYQLQLGEEQLNGVRLDNELKVMQILEMVSQLNQTGPAAPDLNGGQNFIGGQNDSNPVKVVPDEVTASGPSDSVTAGSHPLWTHARTGDFVMPVLSDRLADAVTENKEKNSAAELNYALSAWRGTLRPPMNSFTPLERSRLASGEYAAYYYPFMGWRVEPKMSFANFKKFVLGGYRSKKYRAPLKGDYYVKEVSGALR